MKGYIYITSSGTDPAAGQPLTDPLFGPVPTMGPCRPDLRRVVSPGDWIFIVSGSVGRNVRQYVVGGLRVREKIDALTAYQRFPGNRMHQGIDGRVHGNIITDADGNHHPLDGHARETFDRRSKNYIVGDQSITMDTPQAVARARSETTDVLGALFGTVGDRPVDIIGRNARMNTAQVDRLCAWLAAIRQGG